MTRILRQSTAADVRIGPFVDVTDGFTPETGITLSGADEAEALRAGTATLDISGATWAAVTGADGWYTLSLSTTATNTVGELIIVVQDDSVCLPVYQTFYVVEEAVFDAFFAASAGMAVTLASGAITAAVVATDAIDADAIADNAINAAAIATGAITSSKFAAGAIDAAAIADGAIDAATFAAGAIDAAALAADAGTEIGTAVWASAARSLTVLDEDSTTLDLDATIRAAVGLAAANLDTQLTAIDTKTTNLPSDPADQSLVIAATDALATLIGDVPTNAELATALGTADDATLAAISALDGKVDTVDTVVDAIKVQTDKLTFTVANQIDANIQYVNDVQVTGDGQTGTEWGP